MKVFLKPAFALLVITTFLVVSCSSNEPGPKLLKNEILGSDFIAMSSTVVNLEDKTEVFINFSKNDSRQLVSFTGGCNNMSSDFTFIKNGIRVNPNIDSTAMGCDESLMLQDSKISNFMQGEISASFNEDTNVLTLSKDGKNIVLKKRAKTS